VLLAPGYKSFDQFHDFEDRGRAFGEAVDRLTTHPVGRG
jgi:UDP-N-acetylmuramoylalanine-D-glutamate ligase